MNPLAQLLQLQMTPEMEAYNQYYSDWAPRNGGDAQLFYQAMQARQGQPVGQRPTTDWESDENIRRFIEGSGHTMATGGLRPGDPPTPLKAMWMRPEPGSERMWQYATDGLAGDEQGYPGDVGYENEEADVRAAGWRPVMEFIEEMQAMRNELPPALQLKLDELLPKVKGMR